MNTKPKKYETPFEPEDNCPCCGAIQWEDRWGEIVLCVKCGSKRRNWQFIKEKDGNERKRLR